LSNCAPTIGVEIVQNQRSAAKLKSRHARGFVFLSLFLALVATGPAPAANVPGPPVASVEPGLPFAIADLDGDHRPDLAAIEGGQVSSPEAYYSIRLHLSTGGRRSIELVAPKGGLFIKALDVNGDNAVDLVLSTAWLRQPVAIYLNDGHGGFSRAEPDSFPSAFDQSDNAWNSAAGQGRYVAGTPPQTGGGICSETKVFSTIRPRADQTLPSSSSFVFRSFLTSGAGRAPPSEVSYL
jgi:hypothetical protein